jgi:DNA polymerase epsilon subunit 2
MVSPDRRMSEHSDLTSLPPDAIMKVSVTVLQRVYQLLQGSSTTASSIEQDILDVDAHIFIVDAFEMPQWNWSSERSTFEQ